MRCCTPGPAAPQEGGCQQQQHTSGVSQQSPQRGLPPHQAHPAADVVPKVADQPLLHTGGQSERVCMCVWGWVGGWAMAVGWWRVGSQRGRSRSERRGVPACRPAPSGPLPILGGGHVAARRRPHRIRRDPGPPAWGRRGARRRAASRRPRPPPAAAAAAPGTAAAPWKTCPALGGTTRCPAPDPPPCGSTPPPAQSTGGLRPQCKGARAQEGAEARVRWRAGGGRPKAGARQAARDVARRGTAGARAVGGMEVAGRRRQRAGSRRQPMQHSLPRPRLAPGPPLLPGHPPEADSADRKPWDV